MFERFSFFSCSTALANSSPSRECDYTLYLPSLLRPLNKILEKGSYLIIYFPLLLLRASRLSDEVVLVGDWKKCCGFCGGEEGQFTKWLWTGERGLKGVSFCWLAVMN